MGNFNGTRRLSQPPTNRLNRCICLFIAVFLSLPGAMALADYKEVRSIEGITEYAFDNGLQLLLFPDESKDSITVNITYRVGSKHENYGETGMAHLLEHLLFKGTPKHPNITKELSDHGAQANGTTWLERTNYFETFKATDENLEWALSMESDRMINSFVAQKDLDSEMTVVRNEFEMGENNPGNILLQRIYATAYDWHNYGNSTIGARSDIENVKIENLRAFYEKYYQPDNATLIVAGKIDIERTLELVDRYFGALPKPARKLPEFYTLDPTQDGERTVTLRRVGSEQVVAAAYRIPSGLHEDFAAVSVLARVLGHSPSGRLYKNLVEQQLATQVWAWPNQQQDPGLLYFNAAADLETDLQKTEAVLLKTVEDIAAQPITSEEVARAKRQIAKEMELRFNSSQDISIELSEWIGIGDWRMYFINRDRLEDVTLENVQAVADKYLLRSNRTLGKFLPTAEPVRAVVSAPADISDLLRDYKGREMIAQGEVFDPTPENIKARLKKHELDDMELAFLPIKTRGESVNLELRLGLGTEKSLKHQREVAELTAAMLLRGSSRLSKEQIQDEFDRLKASGGIGWAGQSLSSRYETTRENLVQVLDLIYEVHTEPAFSEKEFQLLKTQKLAGLEASKTDPQALAFRANARSFNRFPKGHVYYTKSIDDEIKSVKKVSLKDVKRFYKKHYGAGNLQLSIVGDFDEAEIKDLMVKRFAPWEAKTQYSRVLNNYKDVEKVAQTIETPDKKNAVFIASTNLDMTADHDDAPALHLVSHMLGGGFINSRLASRIRQQDGLSYGVGSFLQLGNIDTNGMFMAYAISAPENTEKVHRAFTEEMQRAVKDGFEVDELEAAKNGFLDRMKLNFGNNKLLATRLRSDLTDDREIDAAREFIDAVRALTVEDVNRVMKEYLEPEPMTIIKAGDFVAGNS
ncbi:insulinase family protein [Exilibacterium tricleocarpae]|uniref:Insulinase family protein n=2 Tax=Exilibacterium tricleocarpae TaxID=2591008 RepID=A0A545TZV4_9GAMM|nr:insulinase family protein [Exilibacterium tricleocarpae]